MFFFYSTHSISNQYSDAVFQNTRILLALFLSSKFKSVSLRNYLPKVVNLTTVDETYVFYTSI